MESEILNTLQEIRDVLYVIAVIFGLTFLVWVINWIANIMANFRKGLEADFLNQADKYFERADFENLINHCNAKLSDHPNHSHAIWWLARAKLLIGERTEAKDLLQRLTELQPSWKESHIDPYLKDLGSE